MNAPDSLVRLLDRGLLADLLLRCAARDEQAFAEFYRLTSPVLLGVALKETGTRESAETVLVRIYVTIWVRARDLGYDTPVSPWSWTLDIADEIVACRETGVTGAPSASYEDARR